MKLVEQQNRKGIFPLSQSTMDELIRKHPNAAEAENSVLISGPTPYVDPAMFQNITESTIRNIKCQESTVALDKELLKQTRKRIVKAREERNTTILQQLHGRMNKEQLKANELNTMRGASTWLTTLPVCLKTSTWIRENSLMPSALDTARLQNIFQQFVLVENVLLSTMLCRAWRVVHRRPDEVRDLVAFLPKEVCHDIKVKPPLETLTGEALRISANSSDEARLDVSARGLWMRGQRAFFDVTVFNPFAKSHLNQKLNTAFTASENEKKRVIEIEHDSFSPLVFTPYGSGPREAERYITELAVKIAKKKKL